ncbi:MAG: hypothetical protein RTU09_04145 [Candidatus Thorarchaeota archaeon]
MTIPLDSVDVPNESVIRLVPRQLDAVFGSVLIPGQISLLHGPERAPLTMLAHAVAVAAVKSGGKSIFLDSSNNYSPRIARALCKSSAFPERVLKRITVGQVMSLRDLEDFAKQVADLTDVTVVVLDSLTGVLNLTGAPGSKGRQRKLFAALDVLRNFVNTNHVHLLMTDHSTKKRSTGKPSPIGGNIVIHGVDSLVRVDRLDVMANAVRLLVERSPVSPPPGGVVVRISANGIKSIAAR